MMVMVTLVVVVVVVMMVMVMVMVMMVIEGGLDAGSSCDKPCDKPGPGPGALAKPRAPLPPSHNTRGRRGIGAACAPHGVTMLRTRGQHKQVGMDPGPSHHHDHPTTARGRVTRSTSKNGTRGTASMTDLD